MPNRYLLLLALSLLVPAARAQTVPAEPKPLLGFAPANAATEYGLENRFDAQLRADDLRQWMKRLAAHPHHVGSPYDKDNAEYLASLFKSWGYDTRIDVSYVLFPTPKLRKLELLAPTQYAAVLAEKPVPEDPATNQTSEQLPTYNAFSKDGDVTAELVFVNYGVPKDYEELTRRGISVRGKIVLAKYGGSWRGIKPKVAAEQGAIGCLIYSDPKDDGYAQGDVYPKGPFKPETGAQRGSVLDMPTYPGDPLTPGYGSTKNAKRLDYHNAPTITQIPVLPISYGDALPLLSALAGPMAPEAWRGALPIPYHLGPGPAQVHLQVAFNWNTEPVYNVLAMLRGRELPDEWILRGNHHDAWVNGANDPLSGLVAELAEAQAIGGLVKAGWQPRRTLIFCAWDGEEPGLLGSTEWAETNAAAIQQHVVAYLNTDNSDRGFLRAAGSHALEKFFNQVARDVPDPEKSMSIAERRRALDLVSGTPEAQKEARDRADLRLGALGAGSDYSPYIQHLGIPSLNVGFGGEGEGGEYHTIYDTFEDFTRFKDPTFAYGVALAATMGRTELRLVDADVLPFEFMGFSNNVAKYGSEVKQLAETMRTDTEKQAKLLAEHRYEAVANPSQPLLPPAAQPAVPYLNFAPLDNALARVEQSAQAYAQARKAGAAPLAPDRQKALDQLLYKAEQQLLSAEGLPRRPWYRHQLYAPGYYTGYGVKTMPGIREAIEERKWAEAEEQIQRTAAALERFAGQVSQAAALAGSAPAQ